MYISGAGQNLEKEAKFDLMDKDKENYHQKREAYVLSRLKSHISVILRAN